jgi:hypothetical protein
VLRRVRAPRVWWRHGGRAVRRRGVPVESPCGRVLPVAPFLPPGRVLGLPLARRVPEWVLARLSVQVPAGAQRLEPCLEVAARLPVLGRWAIPEVWAVRWEHQGRLRVGRD